MAPEITINRDNCINGKWSIPDPKTGEGVHVDSASMIEHYLTLNEDRPVTADEIRNLEWQFTPDIPKDVGKHGIPGTLRINYTLIK